MAQIDYTNWKEQDGNSSKQTATYTPKVGYFSLKQDGQEAIVRFMHDSPDDFDIVGVHRVQIEDRIRAVNCIGSEKDPSKECPLCESGNSRTYRFYIHLIEYVRDQAGNIVATPKIWERSTTYINRFVNLINEYGPLSDVVFKVKRNGAAGSKDTTYDIMFANPNVYRADLYKKDSNAFNGFKAVGTVVSNYGAEKMKSLVGGAKSVPETEQGPKTYQPTQQVYGAETQETVKITPYAPVETSQTYDSNGFERPRRYQ